MGKPIWFIHENLWASASQLCVCVCTYCAEQDESFLSLLSSPDPITDALHTPSPLNCFPSLVPLSGHLKTPPLSLCVPFTLIPIHSQMFPVTSFLRQFIWRTGNKWEEKTNLLEILKMPLRGILSCLWFSRPSSLLSPSPAYLTTCICPTLHRLFPASLRPCTIQGLMDELCTHVTSWVIKLPFYIRFIRKIYNQSSSCNNQ